MYVVVKVGSHQYKVAEGDQINANRLKDDVGKSMKLDKVLLFAKGNDVRIGQPYLEDVKVTAKVMSRTLDEKKTAFKYRRRKGSASKIGHRQRKTILDIQKIEAK